MPITTFDCSFVKPVICKPYCIIPINILASTVPRILPFPPVMSVPPNTTAVITGRIVSLPISARAEPKYAVKKAPPNPPPNPERI